MYILFPSVLPDTKIKPHKMLYLIYAFIQEKSKPSLTFNPRLVLTAFRITGPRRLKGFIYSIIKKQKQSTDVFEMRTAAGS